MAATPPASQPPAPGTPVPLPPPYAAVPVRTSRSRRGLVFAVVAVVAVVVVILLLFATGVVPWFKAASQGTTGFGAQRANAQHVADSHPGGAWTLVGAVGLLPSTNISGQVNSTLAGTGSIGSGCNLTLSGPTSLYVPGVANVSSGVASDWVFIYRGPSGGFLVVNEVNSTASVIGSLTGTSCLPSNGLGATQPVPGTVVEPTVAASAVNAGGGSAFIRAHPHANATAVLIGGVSLFGFNTGALWVFAYSDCPLEGGAGNLSGATFYAAVNATQGTLLQAQNSVMQCPGLTAPTQLSSVLTVGAPTESKAGSEYWYNFSVLSAGGGLELSNLSFDVQTPTGASVPLSNPVVLAVGITGTAVGAYDMSTALWTSGGTTPVTNQLTFSIATTTSLVGAGDLLVITGHGEFSGTTTGNIP